MLACATMGIFLAGLGLTRAQPAEATHPDTQELIIENLFVRVGAL
jgi:hypothetical protein